MPGKKLTFNRPLIIGHRGFPNQYPENTLVSFEAAVQAGVGMIELDVTLSRDSELVVIHDDTLDRTTNGNGSVSAHTWAELQELDAGGWFHPRFAGQKIPLLVEVLDAFADRTLVNIEIKPNSELGGPYVDRVVQQTLASLEMQGVHHRVLVSSFDPDILQALAAAPGHPALALLLEAVVDETALKLAQKLGALSIHPDVDFVDADTVKMIQSRNFLVCPFNLTSHGQICQAFELGVDGLFVDDPGLAIQCRDETPGR